MNTTASKVNGVLDYNAASQTAKASGCRLDQDGSARPGLTCIICMAHPDNRSRIVACDEVREQDGKTQWVRNGVVVVEGWTNEIAVHYPLRNRVAPNSPDGRKA
jgi:hypothetical protein